MASQFEKRADEFDLGLLERLGEEGLAAFLSSLGNQNPFPNWREAGSISHAQPSSSVLSAGRDYGWADWRSREPAWFIRAVVGGWAAGFAFTAIGSIILKLME